MVESQWKVRVMLFVRAADNTAQNRQTFGGIYANNGSGETVENEAKLFDAPIRLSTSGVAPAQAFGIETAVLVPDMRDDMRAFLDTLPQVRYYVVRNIPNDNRFTGELILDNLTAAGRQTLVGVAPWDTTPFTMADALADIKAERGLLVIPELP